MMPEEQPLAQPGEAHWAIALDWFQINHRSAAALVKDYLCSGCTRRLGAKKEPALQALFAAIESCCSQTPDFINDKLPILESAFRLFLRNGNHPLTLKELSSELGRVRSGDVYRTSPETLLRILKNDRFYGLQEIPG
jgi:hypothetical protein